MDRDKILFGLVIFAVAVAGLNAIITFDKVGKITGYATTGYANLTVEQLVSVNFTTDTVNWASGIVNLGETEAFLDSKTGSVTNGNWTTNSAGLILENVGNVNVTLDILAGKSAASFIGGTSPNYDWLIEEVETTSCTNVTALDIFVDINTTSPGTRFCSLFKYDNNNDSIRIHFNLTVPQDSLTGALGDIITVTATSI